MLHQNPSSKPRPKVDGRYKVKACRWGYRSFLPFYRKECASLFRIKFEPREGGSSGEYGVPLGKQIGAGRKQKLVWSHADFLETVAVRHYKVGVGNGRPVGDNGIDSYFMLPHAASHNSAGGPV